ncbi:hypothetical protein LCY76_23405 [Fictibacillus sp. KIGAM418]|uniref:Uncharacterized protein n=1 Tax=Fictibacillus marinisediminis TaxID=2878389 RepID=A0A9X1XEN2_9BACL|nr:hypothetical protein [Fictibacillus marinisediminis]MCK6259522.1 hypothetical protein [Fictibacillus marinisediminis]
MIRKIAVSLLLIFMVISAFLYFEYRKCEEVVNVHAAVNDIKHDIKTHQQKEKELENWLYTKDFEHETDIDKKMVQRYKDPAALMNFLFASIQMKDPTLFSESFEFEQFSKDLYKNKEEDKLQVMKEMMARISRNDSIQRIGYRVNSSFISDRTEALLMIDYKDKKTVKVPILMKLIGTDHDQNSEIYFITTSIWTIIQTIEKAT